MDRGEGRRVGWVPVSVSPPRSREPDAETAVASEEQVATPNPPPPPQVPPDVDVFTENEEVEEPVEEDEEEDEEDDETAASAAASARSAGSPSASATSLLLVLVACGTIIVWKRRRTRRRREAADPADADRRSVARTDRSLRGGRRDRTPTGRHRSKPCVRWPRPTRRAAATEAQLVGLAREVDRAAYDRTSPPPEAADTAWRYSDEAVDALLANQSLPRRTRMRVDPRTLRRRDPLCPRRHPRRRPPPNATTSQDDPMTSDRLTRSPPTSTRRGSPRSVPENGRPSRIRRREAGRPTVEPRGTGGDWTEVEPAWDPEATVGVSDGLIERIRQEIGTPAPPPPPPSPDPPPLSSAAPPVPASSTPAPPQNSAPPVPAPPPISTPSRRPPHRRSPRRRRPNPRVERTGVDHRAVGATAAAHRDGTGQRDLRHRAADHTGHSTGRRSRSRSSSPIALWSSWRGSFVGSRGGDDRAAADRLRADVGGRIGRGIDDPGRPRRRGRWLMPTGVRRGDPADGHRQRPARPVRRRSHRSGSTIADWAAGTAVGTGRAREPGRLGPTRRHVRRRRRHGWSARRLDRGDRRGRGRARRPRRRGHAAPARLGELGWRRSTMRSCSPAAAPATTGSARPSRSSAASRAGSSSPTPATCASTGSATARPSLLTRDHNVGTEINSAGRDLDSVRAAIGKTAALTSFLGAATSWQRHSLRVLDARHGDRLVMCTDGVHRRLDRDDWADVARRRRLPATRRRARRNAPRPRAARTIAPPWPSRSGRRRDGPRHVGSARDHGVGRSPSPGAGRSRIRCAAPPSGRAAVRRRRRRRPTGIDAGRRFRRQPTSRRSSTP